MSAFIKKLHDIYKAASKPIGQFLLAASTWIVLLAVTGVLSVSYGVLILFGEGYALITLGAFLLLFTSLIARGAANG